MADKNRKTGAFGRRRFLVGTAAAGAAASWPLIITPGKAQTSQQIVFASYGGSYEEWLRKLFWDPFTAETGIKIIATTGAGDLAKLKAQVATGNVEWDAVEVLPTQVATAAREGLIEPLDYSVINMGDLAFPQAKQEFWMCPYSYTGSIGYHTARHAEGKYPKNWAEFWDVAKFPGRRGLRGRPLDNIEIALLADGVDAKKIYPCDVDRAFKSLAKIKPHVNVWVETAPQTASLLQANELDFSNTYAGRVLSANQAGVPLGYATDQLMVFFSTYVIPKGAKNKAAVMRLFNHYMSKPEVLAKYAEAQTYVPTSRKAIELIPADFRKKWVPDPNNPKHLYNDPMWWGEPGRIDELSKRFKEFQLSA